MVVGGVNTRSISYTFNAANLPAFSTEHTSTSSSSSRTAYLCERRQHDKSSVTAPLRNSQIYCSIFISRIMSCLHWEPSDRKCIMDEGVEKSDALTRHNVFQLCTISLLHPRRAQNRKMFEAKWLFTSPGHPRHPHRSPPLRSQSIRR